MAEANRSTSNLDIDTQDAIDKVRAKLAFLMHVKCGDFPHSPGESAEHGEYLILAECRESLASLTGSEGA